MKKNPEQAIDIATEILASGIHSGTLSAPRKASGENQSADCVKIRAIGHSGEQAFQIEEFRGPQAFHRNVNSEELRDVLASFLGTAFSRAEFTTANGTVSVLANRRGELSAIRKPARPMADRPGSTNGEQSCDLPPFEETQAHNRVKNYILREGEPVPFLVDLGVMTKTGAVVKAKYDKFRQINRFLEFIEDVLPELEKIGATREISIIDFGCGKSYLTFAVYHYLATLKRLPVRIIGLDLKRDVIENCADLAKRYGYDRLSFQTGDIAGFAGATGADMVITLHACDTATDYALAQAVRWNARVILSVPCCQHEMNKQLSERDSSAPGRATLESAFKYGIIRERMAALLTDAMRAELLESSGYRVQILEFIDMSHTPKNLLIRAVRHDRATAANGAQPDGTTKADESGYATLRDFLGVEPTLERELKKNG
jgi:SAM-dependent methyltransferase